MEEMKAFFSLTFIVICVHYKGLEWTGWVSGEYAYQTVLSLTFFIDSTKDMGTSYLFLQEAVCNKVPKDAV